MASGVESSPTSGVFIVGEYLGVKRDPGRPRANGEGNWPDRFRVGLRVGADIFDVEYRELDAAAAALEAANGRRPEKGETVQLPVRARAAKGYVFWVGVGELAGAGGDYE